MTDTNQLIDRLREYAAMPPDERARGKILNILATCGASADALAAQQKRIKELEARAALPAAVTVKPLPRHHGSKLGWKLPPDLILEIQQEVTNDGRYTCMEVVEIVALAAERIILSQVNVTPAPVAGWRDFHDWWSTDGHAIDPEPDVSWYDKRRDFAEMAFNAARPPSPGAQPEPEQPSVQEARIKLIDALFAIEGSKAVGDDPKDMAYNEGLEEAKAVLRALKGGE